MEFIRVSQGTAAVLDLLKMKVEVKPTTAYLMVYHPNKCLSNCQFCPQAKKSNSDERLLSRVLWPKFDFKEVVEQLVISENFKRICIQTINYPNMFNDVKSIIKDIATNTKIPISISTHPLNNEEMEQLKSVRLERIGIPVDAATEKLFEKIKGKAVNCPYKWNKHWEALESAVKIFGKLKVSTHLIIGLGETEKDALNFIQEAFNKNILTGLFTFTPIKGTGLENQIQPSYNQYRNVQIARYLIINNISNVSRMKFNDNEQLIDYGASQLKLETIIRSGIPFQTSGCPGCNRPFYNERPGKEMYNYPRKLTSDEIDKIVQTINLIS
ncbi:MAG: radical SAM protein [Candidatus Lokiarchaeota archaeon]|nr:radical SAM protein [Candidatus Lokiarchaeota archaeon]